RPSTPTAARSRRADGSPPRRAAGPTVPAARDEVCSSPVLQSLVASGGLQRLVVALGEVGCLASRVGVEAGRELEIAVLLVEIRGDRVVPRDVFVDLGQGG